MMALSVGEGLDGSDGGLDNGASEGLDGGGEGLDDGPEQELET